MSEFSLHTLASWYDLFQDPDELDLVQATVNLHLPPGTTVNWERLIDTEVSAQQIVSYAFPNDHAAYFTSALETLCDTHAAHTEALTFLPVPLAVEALDLSRPHWRWRLYSTIRMLDKWEHLGATTRAETERLAQRYRGPETTDLRPRAEWASVVASHCLLALKTTAEAATRTGEPAEVHW